MDGGGNSGLVNGPSADYDPRTDGFHNGGAQPNNLPPELDDGRGGLDDADPDDDDPHSRGAQPDMPQEHYEGGGTFTEGPLFQGNGPLFTGSLFGKELELNAETLEK